MGLLITTDIEIFIHKVLQEKRSNSLILVDEVISALHNGGLLCEDVLLQDEYPEMQKLIQQVLEEPCHPKNTPEQDLWCKARGIHHNLTNEKYRKNGFLNHVGNIYTTRGASSI